jgi:opacity protein-like surface antigen
MRLAVSDWVFDSDTRQVIRKGAAAPLSPKSFDLLELLIRQRPKAVSNAEIHDHHSSQVNVGGGVSYALTGAIEVYATYAKSVYGRDGHKIDNAPGFGVSWSFSPQQLARRYFPSKVAGTSGGTP